MDGAPVRADPSGAMTDRPLGSPQSSPPRHGTPSNRSVTACSGLAGCRHAHMSPPRTRRAPTVPRTAGPRRRPQSPKEILPPIRLASPTRPRADRRSGHHCDSLRRTGFHFHAPLLLDEQHTLRGSRTTRLQRCGTTVRAASPARSPRPRARTTGAGNQDTQRHARSEAHTRATPSAPAGFTLRTCEAASRKRRLDAGPRTAPRPCADRAASCTDAASAALDRYGPAAHAQRDVDAQFAAGGHASVEGCNCLELLCDKGWNTPIGARRRGASPASSDLGPVRILSNSARC
jgi:hypothetical protein